MEFILACMYLIACFIFHHEYRVETSIKILVPLEIICKMQGWRLFTMVLAAVWLLKMTDKFLTTTSAILYGMTLNEFRNVHLYKYLFVVRHKKYYHKLMGNCRSLFLLAKFYCRCSWTYEQ
jgi:hypothetical protein